MGATRFLKNYTQEECEKSLNDGFGIGVVGQVCPVTDKIKTPHEVREVKVDGEVIGYNIDKVYLPQSDGWDKYFSMIEKGTLPLSGFPFSVEFPNTYKGKKYQIILVSGQVMEAKVCASGEFAGRGLGWKTNGGIEPQSNVAAWKQML